MTSKNLHRASSWRSTLMGTLIGVLIVQMLLVRWLAQSQVDTAQERNLVEAAARVAEARCLETASPKTRDACRVVATR
ncbi:hypothetical protein BH11PSE13_BH11PSE13_13310 [soil metagenome]